MSGAVLARPAATDDPARWFRTWQPRPQARQRLICLAHAGGAASFYRSWGAALPPSIELVAVQYPGREERIAEAPLGNLAELVERIAAGLERLPYLLDRPYILFGHSMGAAVAHELYLALRRRGRPLPGRLVVSACEGPARHRPGLLHAGSDEALKREMFKLGGTNAALAGMTELLDLVLPVMRGDYQVIETHVPAPDRAPIAAPISAFTGLADTELEPGDAQAWAGETAAAFEQQAFPGGHFYLIEQRDAVLAALLQRFGALGGQWPSTP
jgi:pyochelin biosynthetic protein PchC